MRRLWPWIKPFSGRLLFGLILLLLATPMQLFHPLVWAFIVDEVIGKERADMLVPALAAMLGVQLLGFGLNAWRGWIMGVAGQRFTNEMRNVVYSKLQRQSLGYFHDQRSGDLVSRVMSDVGALQDVVTETIENIIGSSLSFIYVSAIIIWLQPTVGILTLVPLLMVWGLMVFFNRRVKDLYRQQRRVLGDLTAVLQEKIAGMQVIKSFARDSYEVERFRASNDNYLKTSLKAMLARTMYFPAIHSVGFVSNVVMIGLGGLFVLEGKFSLGGLIAYRGYWWQLFSPIMTLARVNEMLQRGKAAAERVFEVLDAPELVQDPPKSVPLPARPGSLRVENVSFAYPERPITLQQISFTADRGQVIGLVGPSGSGKTTLLNLLLRFHDPSAGRITMDGLDYRQLAQSDLRRQFGIVSQEPFLFHDTIRSNLLYGKLDANEAEMREACRLANAEGFILGLPDGYDTKVGERGVKLSGGQKQRICIARAFLANPPFLLLDEATSAVEPESEALIQEALRRLMAGRTTLIVSHRLSMVREAHEILIVRDGRLEERGSHAVLMQGTGWYARMYRLQMGEQG